MRAIGCTPMVLVSLVFFAGPTGATPPGVEVEDRIDVVRVGRRLLAVNADGPLAVVRLQLNERVRDLRSQGLVGVAATSDRLLGVTAEGATWRELDYRIEDRGAPTAVYLGDRVALVPLARRLAGLGPSGWVDLDLGVNERLRQIMADTNLVSAITDRRAIAFAPQSGGFVEIALTPREEIERTSIEDSSITLTTSRRVLIFRSGAGHWTELRRTDRR